MESAARKKAASSSCSPMTSWPPSSGRPTPSAPSTSPFREYAIPVIFRLILGAGLRPPEARRLRRHDVDAENAMVMIERSKRNKDRRVPVTGDLAGLLARFDHLADLRRPDREWFFEDQPGRQYSPAWLI